MYVGTGDPRQKSRSYMTWYSTDSASRRQHDELPKRLEIDEALPSMDVLVDGCLSGLSVCHVTVVDAYRPQHPHGHCRIKQDYN